MGLENRAVQVDLRRRTTYFVLPSRSERVSGAVKAIGDRMCEIQHRAGEVVCPYVLSPWDERKVRQLVQRKFGGFIQRIEAFTPIRLEEGMGTAILIREKGRRW